MAAGYGFGTILDKEPEERNKTCMRIGLVSIGIFLIGGCTMIYLNPVEDGPPLLFRLLNQQKYPASQFFLLMTLGPAIALVPFAERAKGWLADFFAVFGKTAFFYYLLHILTIHISALAVHLVTDGTMHHEWYTFAPFAEVPDGNQWPLWLLYVVFAIDVGLLYVLCRWYAAYKAARSHVAWTKYV